MRELFQSLTASFAVNSPEGDQVELVETPRRFGWPPKVHAPTKARFDAPRG